MTCDTCTLPAGASVALATPLDAEGQLDKTGLSHLVTHVLAGAVRAVCPVGSTGEGARLSAEQRLEVTAMVRELVPPEVPIVAGVPVSAVSAARAELVELARIGATAALVAAPSYFPAPDGDVRRLYTALADTAPLPLVLYNIPQFTKVRIAPDVVGELAQHPRIVGIKDSSRDMEYLSEVLSAAQGTSDFRVLTGTDTLLVASLVAGADGTIAASANVCPGLGTAICAAVARGDLTEANCLQQRLSHIVQTCRRGVSPAGWKAALAILGICADHLAPPASSLTESELAQLQQELGEFGFPEAAT